MTARVPAREEAAAIAEVVNDHWRSLYGADEVVNDHWRSLYGADEVSVETVRTWFELPDVEPLVLDGEAGLAGFADLQLPADDSPAWIYVRVRSGHDRAIGELLAACERRILGNSRARARTMATDTDEAFRRALEEREYAAIRHNFDMLVELDGTSPRPTFPEGIDVRVMRPGEERALYDAYLEAFADHWEFHPEPYETWQSWNLESETARPDLCWVADDDGELAGICLNRMHRSGEPGHGRIEILGVRPRRRRQGLGEALLRHSFHDFRQRGCTRVSLGVDGENTTNAVRLYERVGMHVERRYDIYEKRLDG